MRAQSDISAESAGGTCTDNTYSQGVIGSARESGQGQRSLDTKDNHVHQDGPHDHSSSYHGAGLLGDPITVVSSSSSLSSCDNALGYFDLCNGPVAPAATGDVPEEAQGDAELSISPTGRGFRKAIEAMQKLSSSVAGMGDRVKDKLARCQTAAAKAHRRPSLRSSKRQRRSGHGSKNTASAASAASIDGSAAASPEVPVQEPAPEALDEPWEVRICDVVVQSPKPRPPRVPLNEFLDNFGEARGAAMGSSQGSCVEDIMEPHMSSLYASDEAFNQALAEGQEDFGLAAELVAQGTVTLECMFSETAEQEAAPESVDDFFGDDFMKKFDEKRALEKQQQAEWEAIRIAELFGFPLPTRPVQNSTAADDQPDVASPEDQSLRESAPEPVQEEHESSQLTPSAQPAQGEVPNYMHLPHWSPLDANSQYGMGPLTPEWDRLFPSYPSALGEATPEEISSEVTASDEISSVVTTSEDVTPDHSTPERTTPEKTTSEEATSEASSDKAAGEEKNPVVFPAPREASAEEAAARERATQAHISKTAPAAASSSLRGLREAVHWHRKRTPAEVCMQMEQLVKRQSLQDALAATTHVCGRPTLTGTFVRSQGAAELLVDAARAGRLHLVTQRPPHKAEVARSGHVFVFEAKPHLQRWVDSCDWTPSRKGERQDDMIYRQLPQALTHHQKSHPNKEHEPVSLHNCQRLLCVHADTLRAMKVDPPVLAKALVGSLTDTWPFQPDGLVKRSRRVARGKTVYTVVSYYNMQDVCSGALDFL